MANKDGETFLKTSIYCVILCQMIGCNNLYIPMLAKPFVRAIIDWAIPLCAGFTKPSLVYKYDLFVSVRLY